MIKFNTYSIQNITLYLYCFLLSIENIYFDVFFGVISVSKIGAIFYIATVFRYKSFFFLNRNFVLPLLVLSIHIAAISLININDLSYKIVDMEFLSNIVLFIVILNHSKKDPVVLEKGLLSFAMGAIFVSILFFLGIGIDVSQDLRVTWLGAGHGEIGSKLAIAIIVILMIRKNLITRRFHLLLITSLPFILLAILETGSRTSFLILVFSFILWLIAQNFNKNINFISRYMHLFIGLIAALFFLYIAINNDVFIARFSNVISEDSVNPLGGRLYLWDGFIRIIKDNYIFGLGFPGTELHTFLFRGGLESPHNVVIEVLLYAGIVGLFTYLQFMYRVFSASYQVYKNSRNLLPILLLPAILAFHLTAQGLTEKIVWVLIAYIAGSFLYMKKKSKSKSKSHENSNCN